MNTTTELRYQLLRQLARYEDAYKRALRFASYNMADGVANLDSPFYELVKHYKNKIRKLRNELRSL